MWNSQSCAGAVAFEPSSLMRRQGCRGEDGPSRRHPVVPDYGLMVIVKVDVVFRMSW